MEFYVELTPTNVTCSRTEDEQFNKIWGKKIRSTSPPQKNKYF